MKKSLLVAAFCCVAGLASAQTEITEVNVNLNVNTICLVEGVPEGFVQGLIRANCSVDENANFSFDAGNSGLSYAVGSSFFGIGHGNEPVSATKTYYIKFYLEPKSGYQWPKDLESITYKFNGSVVTPFEKVKRGTSSLVYYLAAGDLATTTLPTLTCTDTQWLNAWGWQNFSSYKFPENASIELQAIDKVGFEFTTWQAEGITLTEAQLTQKNITISMPNNDVTLTPQYAEITVDTIKQVAITIDFEALNFAVGQTEGEVSARLRENASVAEDVNYTLDLSPSTGIFYLEEANMTGIYSHDPVSDSKSYFYRICVVPKKNCVFAEDMSEIELLVNTKPTVFHEKSSYYENKAYFYFAAEVKASPITALENAELTTIFAHDGRIFGAENARIYDLLGRDVTVNNGNLKGVFVVKGADDAQKIIVR